MSDGQRLDPERRVPAKGVHVVLGRPNWVLLTVCTEKRSPWLAQSAAQRALHKIWQDQATAWLVSNYVLMPDHLHLFCAPRDLKFTIERWMSFWKDRFAKARLELGAFQAGGFHHRLRADESYAEKWQYVRENPLRKGLVERPQDWPFCGRVHQIRWSRGNIWAEQQLRPTENAWHCSLHSGPRITLAKWRPTTTLFR